jgi:predicted ester cyclase
VGDSNVEAIRSAVGFVNSGDIESYLGGFHPDCLRWVATIATPFSLDEVGENLRLLGAGFDRLRLVDEALFGGGDLVCARWRLRGTHVADYLGLAATGREIDVEMCEVYQFDHGQVAATWAYGDPGQLFRQIMPAEEGVVP